MTTAVPSDTIPRVSNNRLRVLRAEQRKTQWAVALAANINPGRLSLIENSHIDPTPRERAALARVLGVDEAVAFPPAEESERSA